MKRIWRWLPLVMVILVLLLTSCGPAAPEAGSSGGGSTSSGGGNSGSTSGDTPAAPASGGGAGGDVVVTQDNAKQTIEVKVGQKVMVKLPTDYNWKISSTPDIILATSDTKPTEDTQGIFDAKMVGKATIQSTGSANCLKDNPPCTKPTIQFDVSFNITQ